MKNITKYILGIIILLVFHSSFGQNRMITGKVVDQNLTEFPGVIIMTSELKAIDTTDWNGNFEFKYTKGIKKIKLIYPMTQSEEIEITPNCNHIEIILLTEWIYDFVSLKRAKRKKERERKRLLPKLYVEAIKKGIFENKKNCR